jgi:cytoskeletal protein CcmA (bactofilin family)
LGRRDRELPAALFCTSLSREWRADLLPTTWPGSVLRAPAGAVSILLSVNTMALFRRPQDPKDRTYGEMASAQLVEVAPHEVMMSDRERSTNQFAPVDDMDAFLGKGTTITGELTFEGAARIDGKVEGEIRAQDVLTIGESAVVNAKIDGTTIVIEGHVTGDVTARQRLEFRASARVNGNVATPRLVMHEGAILNGQCSMADHSEPKGVREKPDVLTPNPDHVGDAVMRVSAGIQR